MVMTRGGETVYRAAFYVLFIPSFHPSLDFSFAKKKKMAARHGVHGASIFVIVAASKQLWETQESVIRLFKSVALFLAIRALKHIKADGFSCVRDACHLNHAKKRG